MLTLSERWEAMTEQEQDAVRALHAVLAQTKAHPEIHADPVQLIEDIEYTLQGLWKFDRSYVHHTHWMDIKGCTCPVLDNREGFGFRRIRAGDCKWHGAKA
jgi:hypothetical protein